MNLDIYTPSTTNAPCNLYRFNDQKLDENSAQQEDYWFWSEFIAESISLYVEEQYHSVDNRENYSPKLITWEPEAWSVLADKLQDYLEITFKTYPIIIDEAALAMYFATLLIDDAKKRYVKAAK